MQDQNEPGGINDGSAGMGPSIMQTVDPNRSSTVTEPSGSRSLSLDENVTVPAGGKILNNQTSVNPVVHPIKMALPSNDRTLPTPVKFNGPAVIEICNMLESAIQSARTRDVLSSDEIMLFILHHNWGLKLVYHNKGLDHLDHHNSHPQHTHTTTFGTIDKRMRVYEIKVLCGISGRASASPRSAGGPVA